MQALVPECSANRPKVEKGRNVFSRSAPLFFLSSPVEALACPADTHPIADDCHLCGGDSPGLLGAAGQDGIDDVG